MIKKSGKVYEQVREILKGRGVNVSGLKVATLGRGPNHLIVIGGDVVGEYNHRSKQAHLYQNRPGK